MNYHMKHCIINVTGVTLREVRIMADTLIAFFSRAGENYFDGDMKYIKVGNTEIICNFIKELINADVFKIEMKHPYSEDYMTCAEEAKKDLNDNVRPELSHYIDSVEEYEKIILAYPNYWGTVPMAVLTFLEKYDFKDKVIYPLCTNEGSGMGSSELTIIEHAKDAKVDLGLSILGHEAEGSREVVREWLMEKGLIKFRLDKA